MSRTRPRWRFTPRHPRGAADRARLLPAARACSANMRKCRRSASSGPSAIAAGESPAPVFSLIRPIPERSAKIRAWGEATEGNRTSRGSMPALRASDSPGPRPPGNPGARRRIPRNRRQALHDAPIRAPEGEFPCRILPVIEGDGHMPAAARQSLLRTSAHSTSCHPLGSGSSPIRTGSKRWEGSSSGLRNFPAGSPRAYVPGTPPGAIRFRRALRAIRIWPNACPNGCESPRRASDPARPDARGRAPNRTHPRRLARRDGGSETRAPTGAATPTNGIMPLES